LSVRLLDGVAKTRGLFGDPDLVSRAGLVALVVLARRAGLAGLVAAHVRPGGGCGVGARLKIGCLVAGRAAGRAASAVWACCGTASCRACSAGSGRRPRRVRACGRVPGGDVRRLGTVDRGLPGGRARRALLPGRDMLACIDIGALRNRACGRRERGAGFGHATIRGKSLLVAG
jgi:hypothetical protein